MVEPASEERARNRWLVINAVRIAGVALVVVGLLGTQGAIDVPIWAAYALLAAGFAGAFLAPTMLARRWRSPDR